MVKREKSLKWMLQAINYLIEVCDKSEGQSEDTLAKVHPDYLRSATNLIHYRSLRTHDIRSLQKLLGEMSLSRLAKAESHVMASLKMNRAILKSFINKSPLQAPQKGHSPKKANRLQKANAKALLGYRSKGRRTRIMVTLPSTAANDYDMVYQLVKEGMNCARINCAHDDKELWQRMIEHVRTASAKLGKQCKVTMDLGGPKIRTGQLAPGPKVQKLRPAKNIRGQITEPLTVWLSPLPHPQQEIPHFPVEGGSVETLNPGDTLYFQDARKKRRKVVIVGKESGGIIGHLFKTTYIETGLPLFLDKKCTQGILQIGLLPPTESIIYLKNGDLLHLLKDPIEGAPHQYDEQGQLKRPARISCTNRDVFDSVKIGERILFDDGKIEGQIEAKNKKALHIRITNTPENGGKLRADKGINLPESQLKLQGLTQKDREDLKFVVQHADVVNMSFVNSAADVEELYQTLNELGASDDLGIIFKIETQMAFNQLTDILLAGMQRYPIGVMIARGDLAIECGWNNIARVQEEILSLCQAAHVTDIWATQVLENLAKRGIPSRAEITDAAMAQRADCVMLNKGPHIIKAIQLLDTILKDLDAYQHKNAPMLPAMQRAAYKEE